MPTEAKAHPRFMAFPSLAFHSFSLFDIPTRGYFGQYEFTYLLSCTSFAPPKYHSFESERNMPKIISYTPSWLSRPSPGYHLFSKSSTTQQSNGTASTKQNEANIANKFTGNRRTIARRGTELLVVVDDEIRWSDLCMLKDVWEETQQKGKKSGRDSEETEDTNGDFDIVDHDDANVGYRVGYILSQTSQPIILILGLGS